MKFCVSSVCAQGFRNPFVSIGIDLPANNPHTYFLRTPLSSNNQDIQKAQQMFRITYQILVCLSLAIINKICALFHNLSRRPKNINAYYSATEKINIFLSSFYLTLSLYKLLKMEYKWWWW